MLDAIPGPNLPSGPWRVLGCFYFYFYFLFRKRRGEICPVSTSHFTNTTSPRIRTFLFGQAVSTFAESHGYGTKAWQQVRAPY